MIDVRDLTFRFDGAAQPALRSISLHVEAGEFVVLTGPSGCGKSTLALALGGYLFHQYGGETQGSVTVAGFDARRAPIYEIASAVGLVQQSPENQFCTLTVADEMAFGLENRCLPREEIGARMDWALDVVGAAHLRERLLATLSGGEKQKVAIAAMLAAQPRVLILDEPTSNLDPTATRAILEVIARLRRDTGVTVIVIEHKIAYLRDLAPRVLVMQEGSLLADGSVAPPVWPPAPPVWPPAPPAHHAPPAGEPLVTLRDLAVVREGRDILRDINAEIRPGEFVSVMGDNGAGKSTLLRCLLGLLKPDRGQAVVCGHDTRHTPVSKLAREVGLVFQNPDHQLFAETVWDEAMFGPRNFAMPGREPAVAALLADYGLSSYRDRHPYRLSFGEKRRLNLVSLLSYGPRLLLLDEVLIGQDARNVGLLMEQLTDYVHLGGAVLSVSHDPLTTLRYAHRVLFLEQGRLLLDAPPQEAFARLQELGRQPYLPLYAEAA